MSKGQRAAQVNERLRRELAEAQKRNQQLEGELEAERATHASTRKVLETITDLGVKFGRQAMWDAKYGEPEDWGYTDHRVQVRNGQRVRGTMTDRARGVAGFLHLLTGELEHGGLEIATTRPIAGGLRRSVEALARECENEGHGLSGRPGCFNCLAQGRGHLEQIPEGAT